MANTNFVVHNGLTVGPASIDATSGNISTTAQIVSTNATTSTSTVTGALVLTGGAGIGGNIYLGSNVFAGNPTYNDVNIKYAGSLNINNYVQSILQNTNNGSSASSDFIVNNDQSTATTYYGDFGINSSGFSGSGSLNGSNNVYLTSTSSDLVLGTTTNNSIRFVINSGTTDAMFIGTSGNLVVTSSTNSTSSTTGSIITAGGIGASGAIYANTHTGVAIYAGTIGNTGTTLTGTLSTAAQTNITSVGTLSSLAVSGVITSGGNINVTSATNSTSSTTGSIVTAGGIGVAQDAYIGGKLYVGGNTTFINTTIINTTDTLSAPTILAGQIGNSGTTLTGTLSTASQTNITSVGTLGGLTVSGAIVPSSNASINIGGTSSQYFNNVYAVNFLGTSTTAKYADLAERYSSDADYEAGTVVDFGGTAEVTLSNISGSQYVAGVVSTNPAYMMNSDADGLYIALVGRVPCKVTGPVEKGAMMVSNGDGTARMERNPKMGSVIGKALESFPDGVGVIEVVVGRL